MAEYINKGNEAFASSVNGEYVDKSGLIAEINDTLFKNNRFTCVTRSRRFGKSMAAEMLCAYYDKSCDSRNLFKGLEIENHPSFEEHLNKYPVIYVDMTNFLTDYGHDSTIVEHVEADVIASVVRAYPNVALTCPNRIMDVLIDIAKSTGDRFVMIIDEWDGICREFGSETAMDEYVKLLRRMFKSTDAVEVFAGVYMTGILPIKKYKTESALNNFWEYSAVDPMNIPQYFGFTKVEVRALCEKHNMDFEEMEKWYDGYSIGTEPSMFNPSSVMKSLKSKRCRSYWAATGAFDAVARYIQMDFKGLKGDIVNMLAGGRCSVDTTGFKNDPAIIKTKDDVFTLLIHLGYLAYDSKEEKCHVPNLEVAKELKNAIVDNGWQMVIDAINNSEELLESLLAHEAEEVAAGIQKIHEESTSLLKYNDENALSCVINLAFYSARNKFKIIRELPAGKGFADVVFVPWRNVDLPAIIVELKWKKDAVTAIGQIKERHYPVSLKEYAGDVILCGINYEKDGKEHTCVIEKA